MTFFGDLERHRHALEEAMRVNPSLPRAALCATGGTAVETSPAELPGDAARAVRQAAQLTRVAFVAPGRAADCERVVADVQRSAPQPAGPASTADGSAFIRNRVVGYVDHLHGVVELWRGLVQTDAPSTAVGSRSVFVLPWEAILSDAMKAWLRELHRAARLTPNGLESPTPTCPAAAYALQMLYTYLSFTAHCLEVTAEICVWSARFVDVAYCATRTALMARAAHELQRLQRLWRSATHANLGGVSPTWPLLLYGMFQRLAARSALLLSGMVRCGPTAPVDGGTELWGWRCRGLEGAASVENLVGVFDPDSPELGASCSATSCQRSLSMQLNTSSGAVSGLLGTAAMNDSVASRGGRLRPFDLCLGISSSASRRALSGGDRPAADRWLQLIDPPLAAALSAPVGEFETTVFALSDSTRRPGAVAWEGGRYVTSTSCGAEARDGMAPWVLHFVFPPYRLSRDYEERMRQAQHMRISVVFQAAGRPMSERRFSYALPYGMLFVRRSGPDEIHGSNLYFVLVYHHSQNLKGAEEAEQLARESAAAFARLEALHSQWCMSEALGTAAKMLL